MTIEEEWLRRLWAVVDQEASASDGKLSSGYRAVAEKTGIAYEYIYQMYQGKPKDRPRLPTKHVMQKIEAVYGPPDPAQALKEPIKQVQSTLSPLAENLGKLFDRIPEDDLVRRSIAYAKASQAIVSVLQEMKANSASEAHQ